MNAKQKLFHVATNGFLMSQRRSTLMSLKTEYVNVSKIDYFHVCPTKMILTMLQKMNLFMFPKKSSEFLTLSAS